MELHHIRYFQALARTLNYTEAADQCYISRQALRQTVQSIEREYHVKLIENRRNRLSLTPAGELLSAQAGPVLSAWEALDGAMRSFAFEARPVRLGISVSLMPLYAPELLGTLNRLSDPFPAMKVERAVADADSLLDGLREGALDAVIAVDLGAETPGISRTVLRRDEAGFLLSVTHPLADRTQLCLGDLEGQTIALMSAPERCFRPLMDALRERGVNVRVRVIPEAFEAFQAVRHDGLLALDRIDRMEAEPVALERDLPVADFPMRLETALLLREDAAPELRMLAKYLRDMQGVYI